MEQFCYQPETVREHLDREHLRSVETRLAEVEAEVQRLRVVAALYRRWLVETAGRERVDTWELAYESLFGAAQRNLDMSA